MNKFALCLLLGATFYSMNVAAATYMNGGMSQKQNYPSSGEYMYRDNYGNMYRAGNNPTDQQMRQSYNDQNPNMNQNQYYQPTMNQSQNNASGMMNENQSGLKDQDLLYRIRNVLDSSKDNFYTGVNVAVNNGTVTLTGIVQNEQERNDLKNLVQKINGVGKIDDQLYVRATLDKVQDQLLSQRAVDALQNSTAANEYKNVQISVRDGVITLLGTVELENQKREAEYKVQRLPGARSINNQIKVIKK